MRGEPLHGMPWWTLPVQTADGRRTLDCRRDPAHRVVIVSDGHPFGLCSSCGRRCRVSAWATLDRDVVLCGTCHDAAHDGDPLWHVGPAPIPDAPRLF